MYSSMNHQIKNYEPKIQNQSSESINQSFNIQKRVPNWHLNEEYQTTNSSKLKRKRELRKNGKRKSKNSSNLTRVNRKKQDPCEKHRHIKANSLKKRIPCNIQLYSHLSLPGFITSQGEGIFGFSLIQKSPEEYFQEPKQYQMEMYSCISSENFQEIVVKNIEIIEEQMVQRESVNGLISSNLVLEEANYLQMNQEAFEENIPYLIQRINLNG